MLSPELCPSIRQPLKREEAHVLLTEASHLAAFAHRAMRKQRRAALAARVPNSSTANRVWPDIQGYRSKRR